MEIQQKLRMKKLVRKSVIAKSKKGFTLLELTVSLFLLVILTLLLMLILQTTINTSKRFLDYSNYEYALADNQIYMDKFKNSNDFAGYILILKHIKGYTLSVEDETIHILIVDKNNHERDMYLKIKNEKTDKEKAQEEKEKEEKAKKDKDKHSKDNVEIEKIKPITNNEEGS